MRRISSHLLLTPQGLLSDRVVVVSDEGTVLDISIAPDLDRQAGVEFFPGVLVPGFWNAHSHLELSHLRGLIAPGGGFTGFAQGMREVRGGFSVEQRRAAAEFWDAKMWSEGVAAVSDVCNGSSTFGVKRSSSIRYHNFCELFGLGADPAHVFALRDEARAAGLEAEVTPHSTYSLSREDFATAAGCRASSDANRCSCGSSERRGVSSENAETASDGEAQADRIDTRNPTAADPTTPSIATLEHTMLSIHFLESEDEIDLFRRQGPMWDWYARQDLKPDFLDYGSPAERLVAQIPPDHPVMLIHNCCTTQRDIDIVMGHFTAPVTWVVCPGSNRYISGLTPPVDLLRKNRLRIAVGTDSLASNETLSMVRELSFLKNIPLGELLSLAAADTIEVGHTPGLVLLTGVDFEKMALTESTRARRII